VSCVFISYASDSGAVVSRLAEELRKSGVIVWLGGDEPWLRSKHVDALSAALRNGVRFIGCFSQEYIEHVSRGMKLEVEVALAELNRAPHDRSWFIPLCLGDVRAPSYVIDKLSNIPCINVSEHGVDLAAATRAILRSITSSQSILDCVAETLNMDTSETGAAELMRLSQLEQKTLFALNELISSSVFFPRNESRDVFGQLGPLPAIVVSILASALSHSQPGVQQKAVDVLATSKLDERVLVRVVLAALRHSNPSLRRNTMNALRANWLSVRQAARRALKDPDAALRARVADALGEIGELAVPTLLAAAVGGADAYTRFRASQALKRLGPSAQNALAAAQDNRRKKLRRRAAEALGGAARCA